MNQGKYVFAQIFEFVSHNDFIKCVEKYDGDYKTKHFSCWKQFLCMAFGQLTHRESLSDTVLCIKANSKKLYHLGIGTAISKSTLSKANENRDWQIYQDFALLLIAKAKALVITSYSIHYTKLYEAIKLAVMPCLLASSFTAALNKQARSAAKRTASY